MPTSLRRLHAEQAPLLPRSQAEPAAESATGLPARVRGHVADYVEHLPDASVTVAGGVVGFCAGYGALVGLLSLRSNQSVPASAAYWKQAARSEVYGRCYEGCDEKDFYGKTDALLACPEQACAKTLLVHVPDVVCDATKLWTWAERVPEPCLPQLGTLLRQDALAEAHRHAMHHVTWGVIVGLLTCYIGAGIALSVKRKWHAA